MKRYWTADMHMGHGRIIEYCDRPFKTCDHMNERLVAEANMRVKAGDTCVHVGDFSMKDGWKYSDRLTGNWVFLRGNHDKNNKVKSVGDWLFLRLSHFRIFVSHVPYYYRHEERTADFLLSPDMIDIVEATCDFAVCGHVHEKWRVSREGSIPTINVGVDVNNYRPISDDELLKIYHKEDA